MTRLTLAALLLSTASFPLSGHADTIPATSRITAVTIYPQGAEVTRDVTFTAPPGAHDLVITDLPLDTDPTLLRLTSPDAALGAFALRTDRIAPSAAPKSAAMIAAETEVETAEAARDGARAALAAIQARIEAQTARIGFLTGLRTETSGQTAESLTAIADMVAGKVLEAREAAIQAEAGLPGASKALTAAQEKLDAAIAARDALSQGARDRASLSLALTAQGGEAHVTLTHFVAEASWRPVYDLRLDRKAGRVALERGLLVTQYGGEDWEEVALTLSTAQPGQQAEASRLYPDLREIRLPEPEADTEAAAMGEVLMAAPVTQSRGLAAEAVFQGDTVTYRYPAPVSLADGIEDLRLALDSLDLPATTLALGVPRLDRTAFLEAEVTNAGTEILLPGTAFLYRDGMLTGQAELEALAPGAKVKLGFGAIPGLVLSREMPERMTGDRGVFTTSTEMQEKAVLKVENLTDEAWALRIIDQVPYSEQEELKVTHEAEPAPSVTDLEGQRGILAWDFELAPKATQDIILQTTLSWPEGKVLQ